MRDPAEVGARFRLGHREAADHGPAPRPRAASGSSARRCRRLLSASSRAPASRRRCRRATRSTPGPRARRQRAQVHGAVRSGRPRSRGGRAHRDSRRTISRVRPRGRPRRARRAQALVAEGADELRQRPVRLVEERSGVVNCRVLGRGRRRSALAGVNPARAGRKRGLRVSFRGALEPRRPLLHERGEALLKSGVGHELRPGRGLVARGRARGPCASPG